MSVLIGHASISETGGINGAKGDSTGKEVCTREWYSKPWDYMAIHPDAAVREKHAKAVEAACANDNIGYGQSDRNSLYTLAKAVGYDLSKVGKCNCDCSSLQNVAAMASGAPGATYGTNGWTTSTMLAALKASGYIIITDSTYLKSADYCVRGAIYVKASSHTVTGLTNGTKADQTLAKAGITASSIADTSASTNTTASFAVGDKVTVNGTIYGNGNGSGGSIKKINATMYVVDVANSKTYKHYIGVATKKDGMRQGWAEPSILKADATANASSSPTAVTPAATAAPYYKAGTVYTTQVELKVRTGAGTSYKALTYAELSANAQANDSDKDGAINAGTKVTCKAIKQVGSDIWMQIPSGWIAAYYGGKVYVK